MYPFDQAANIRRRLQRTARREFMENVSLTGLVDLYNATSSLVKYMWIVAYLVSICSIVYHCNLFLREFRHQSPQYDFNQRSEMAIPFPKVTVCVPSGIDRQRTASQIHMGPREQQRFDGLSSIDQQRFVENVSGLMGNNMEFIYENNVRPSADPRYFVYHHVLIETSLWKKETDQPMNVRDLMAACSDVVADCRLNGVEFDCCSKAWTVIDDQGPCFDLGVDRPSWDAKATARGYPRRVDGALGDASTSPDQSEDRTQDQATPVADRISSITFDLLMNWNHILPSSMTNGFSLHIGDTYSLMGRPVSIPGGMHAWIDITQPKLLRDIDLCFDEVPDEFYSRTNNATYDARGYECQGQRYVDEIIRPYAGCTFDLGSFVPEDSDRCTEAQALPLKMFISHGFDETPASKRSEEELRRKSFDTFHSRTKCLPLCQRWEYSARPSYSGLLADRLIVPDGSATSSNITRSRVTIYNGSPFYMQISQKPYKEFYKTFLSIATVMACYFGFSIVTFAEILFYGWRVGYVAWRSRRVGIVVVTAGVPRGEARV